MSSTMMHMREAVRTHIGSIPPLVVVCAYMVYYDLMHGPAWARIPGAGIEHITGDDLATFRDDLELSPGDQAVEVYTSVVAETLRDYIDGLPSVLYWEEDTGECYEHEPEGEEIDGECYEHEPEGEEIDGECYEHEPEGEEIDGEYYEPMPYCRIEHDQIVEALFGKIIAREFR